MKYIRTESENGTHEIFIFPKSIDHDAMMEALSRIKNQTHGPWERVLREPVSAGFVDANGACYGESISIGLASDKSDTELLKSLHLG